MTKKFQKKITNFENFCIIFVKNQKNISRVWQKNVCMQMDFQKNDLEEIFRSNFLLSFLKIYVMGATEIDFVGIAHVKVGLIAHQKILVCIMGGNFV